MLINSIKMQMSVLLSKKNVVFLFFALLLLMLTNYFSNVFNYSGTDILDMMHPMMLLTLSTYSSNSFYLMQLYPLLIIIPAGLSYFNDKNSQEMLLIQTRVGGKNYFLGKMIAVFLVTFLVFATPFLIEIILNIIAFPLSATGHVTGSNVYELNRILGARSQLLYPLYAHSKYLYALVFTVIFGITSGILAVFAVSFSMIVKVNYGISIFLPTYLLFYLLGMAEQVLNLSIQTRHSSYLLLFNIGPSEDFRLSGLAYFMFMFILFSISAFIFRKKAKEDMI
jgi:hypothetical protein